MKWIGRLRGALPREIHELDSADQRLEDISKHATAGQWEKVWESVDELFEADIFDVRPIVHYLWSVYGANGIAALPDVLDVVMKLATSNLESVGPVRKRAEHMQKRFAWLFQQIARDIEFHESRKTPTWSQWERSVPKEAVGEWIDTAKLVDASLPADLDQVRQPLGLVVARLRRLHVVTVAAPPQTVEEAAPGPEGEPALVAPEVATIRIGSQTAVVELRPAHKFFELAEKLKAFTDLVERSDFVKAAIVADDLTQLIEHFDPRAYFPSMFSDFAKLMSEHISVVAEQWARKDSLAWRAQAEFYKVDLKRFVSK